MSVLETQESVGNNDAYAAESGENYESGDNVLDPGLEEFESAEQRYLEELAVLHEEHYRFRSAGLIGGTQFWPYTIDDFYNENIHTITCFYFGDYPFDKWEEDYENYLYVQVCNAKYEDHLCTIHV